MCFASQLGGEWYQKQYGRQYSEQDICVGGVTLYFIGVLYLFLGIAIVCGDFFVGSLELISDRLGLSEDVAGATFMAAGSSAPELFSSLMALSNDDAANDIGVGTIVGSAVFNILIIIGVTAFFAGQTLFLDYRPLVRDTVFYSAAVIGVICIFHDGKVYWWEGLISVLAYAVYIVTMKFNQKIMTWVPAPTDRTFGTTPQKLDSEGQKAEEKAPLIVRSASCGGIDVENREASAEHDPFSAGTSDVHNNRPHSTDGVHNEGTSTVAGSAGLESGTNNAQSGADPVDLENARTETTHDSTPGAPMSEAGVTPIQNPANDQPFPRLTSFASQRSATSQLLQQSTISEDSRSNFLGSAIDWCIWFLSLPWNFAFSITIPQCRNDAWKNWYIVTFIMAIVWIGIISWYMVAWTSDIGCVLGIPSSIMGVTVLAAGTSIPDALSSIAVAKGGKGDMAVANAVGSNVFDIWIGLGLPWLLTIPFKSDGSTKYGSYIKVENNELLPNILILFGVLALYLLAIVFSKWKLLAVQGYIFIATYVVYAVYNIVAVGLLDVYGNED